LTQINASRRRSSPIGKRTRRRPGNRAAIQQLVATLCSARLEIEVAPQDDGAKA
jgi:hypothetical protein